MVSMGIVGLIMFLTGIGPKLEQLTTVGVTIPISGMVVAIGGVTAGVKALELLAGMLGKPAPPAAQERN